MKLSLNWLKDYLDIEKTPEELAEDLSLFGHEVETIEKTSSDTIFNLEITPNRGDCLSVLGLAREIAALYERKVKSEKLKVEESRVDKNIQMSVADPEICPRYTARVVDNVEIKQSPEWLRKRLESYGFRAVNNIVDITNFVMVAMGQPLHAFDYDKIQNGQIDIFTIKNTEELVTLDSKKRILPEGTTVIRDQEKIYDLAGIMGGESSEVEDNTKTIILQGAIFDSVLIRRASKKLNLTTDASYRYERGVDYENTVLGVDLATSLILESCPEAKVGQLIDLKNKEQKSSGIILEQEKVNKLIGADITLGEMMDFLKRLNFSVKEIDKEKIEVFPPSYRFYDIHLWQDLAEEIARVYGYNNIGKNKLQQKSPEKNSEWLKREKVKDVLKELGMTEIYSYSFADKDKIELLDFKIEDCVEIVNPLSPETQYLRPSILPSLLSAVAKNPWAPEVNVFEIEKVFSSEGEKWQLGLMTVGKNDSLIKQALEKLGIAVEIKKVEADILAKYKIRRPVSYVTVDFSQIDIVAEEISEDISSEKFRPISKFPPTVRDLAFIVDNNLNKAEVSAEILKTSEKILLVEAFDEFASEKFGENKKNLAFHVWLQDLQGPISEKETEKIIQDIIRNIGDKFKAKLRS